MGKVVLVGAGPGDPGLITQRGIENIAACDVLLYDHLVGREILSYARKDCILIDVGKRSGGMQAEYEGRGRTVSQEETCALMIALARKYDLVVRLKGGDPFVFGRGYEEIEALRNAKVSYEIVPGITAAAAAAESAGIPLTHRGVSRSFHVVAGHRMDDEALNESELKNLAEAEGTLVFLMAVKNLEAICEGLIRHGKAADTPAAVVENGSLPAQRRIDGTLQSIAERARAAGTVSPAVLVIGETARLDFREKTEPAGHGKKVYAIGTADTLLRLRQIAAGHSLQVCPVLELEPVLTEEYKILLSAVGRMEEYAWILFVSRQAVKIFGQALRDSRTDVRRLAGCRFAVNSVSVKKELEKLGIHADFVSESPYSDAFAEEFVKFLKETARAAGTEQAVPSAEAVRAAGTERAVPTAEVVRAAPEGRGAAPLRILLLRAMQGTEELEKSLAEEGLKADVIRAYDVRIRTEDRADEMCIRTEDRAGDLHVRTDDVHSCTDGARSWRDDAYFRPDEEDKNAAGGRTEEIYAFWESLEKAMKQQDASFVFLSSSGVRAFAKVLRKKQLNFPAGAVYYCMGPRTKEALLCAYAQSEGSPAASFSAYTQSEGSSAASSAYAQSAGAAEMPQISGPGAANALVPEAAVSEAHKTPGPETAQISKQEPLRIHIPKPCTLQGLAEKIRNAELNQ